MIGTTSIAGRCAALCGSAVVHVGVVLALTGHAPSGRAAKPEQAVEVTIESDVSSASAPEPALVENTAASARAPRRAAAPTHKHAYPVPAQHDAKPHDEHLVHVPLPTAPASAQPAPLATNEPVRPLAASSDAALAITAPRFVMRLGHDGVGTHASASVAARGDAQPGGLDSAPGEAEVDTPARLVYGGAPTYPAEARAQGIEADLPLEIVVDDHGRVARARVLKDVGYGLVAAALSGVRAYRFSPAVRFGRPTAVRMKWTMLFRLQ
jgi:protein TonB